MKYVKRAVLVCGAAVLLCWLFSVAAYATGSGDVAGAGGKYMGGGIRADQDRCQQCGISCH